MKWKRMACGPLAYAGVEFPIMKFIKFGDREPILICNSDMKVPASQVVLNKITHVVGRLNEC